MQKDIRHSEKGDTLIEVLLVTAILSLIVVGATMLMNRAFAGTQVALEQTIVRQSIDGQVEMLTFARDQTMSNPASDAASVWNTILNSHTTTTVSQYGSCTSGNTRRFSLYMNGGTTLTLNPTISPASGIASAGQGVWIEAQRPAGANYVDFHVYGCWESPTSGPDLTTGTVVRLYVP